MSTMNRFPTGGGSSDTATAEPNNVLKGYTFVGKNSDDIQTGTLELIGNAVVNHVIKGATFYTTDAKTKLTGTMEVGNVSNLNLAVSSGRNITITWSNPTQATGRPYSGVYIKYSTNGNPGTGGTQIYKGTGNNTASGGRSSVTLGFPNLSTRYYISVYSYCVTSSGELIGTPIQSNITTGGTSTQTITSSRNVTVPSGYSLCDIFCVGGGGGGGGGEKSDNNAYGSSGAGGGYTKTVFNISVSSGQVLNCVIGGGGGGSSSASNNGGTGGTTYVNRSGATLCTATGGSGGGCYAMGNGGSGGGGANNGRGGSNGGNGSDSPGYSTGRTGKGQGTTTRPFGESSGTAYSGGGGGGGRATKSYPYPVNDGGSGGWYGGAYGGNGFRRIGGSSDEPDYEHGYNGNNGTANSGGGGGGGGGNVYSSQTSGGSGGSGIILIRFK